jgi:hypothetical protein
MWKNLIDLQPRGGAAAPAAGDKSSSEDRLNNIASDV